TERRAFQIDQWTPSLLIKDLNFDRSSYGTGERVEVYGSVKRAGGEKTEVMRAHIDVRVDGSLVYEGDVNTDGAGKYRFGFALPVAISRGVGQARVTFFAEGAVESVSKPFPVLVNKVELDFYPEGGNLIATVPNRVYFQAKTPLGKPADVEAVVVDEKDN